MNQVIEARTTKELHIYISRACMIDKNINYSFVLGEYSELTLFLCIYDIDDADICVTFTMQGHGARVTCKALYMLKDEEQVRISVRQEHSASASTTDVLFKGIMTGRARIFFNGIIVVSEQGKKSSAALYNKNIMLSGTAYAHSKPQLEVLTNDVQCKHGSAISQLDVQQLLYAQARGLDVRTAQRVLLESFVADCVASQQLAQVQTVLHSILSGENNV